MSASALRLELGDLGVEAGATVVEHRLGLRVGLGEQPLAFAVDVAERGADLGRMRLGRRRPSASPAPSRSAWIRAVRAHALGDRRPCVLPER
jgi:hypothetical protein